MAKNKTNKTDELKKKLNFASLNEAVSKKDIDAEAANSILDKKKSVEKVVEEEKKKVEVKPIEEIQKEPKRASEEIENKEELKSKEEVTKNKKRRSPAKGTYPPDRKKRASFNIDEDLHKAIKDYCYFQETDMVDYIFNLVKADLKKKKKFPPPDRE